MDGSREALCLEHLLPVEADECLGQRAFAAVGCRALPLQHVREVNLAALHHLLERGEAHERRARALQVGALCCG